MIGAALPAGSSGCGADNSGGIFRTPYEPMDVPKGSAAAFFMGGDGMIGYFICQDDNGFYAMDGNCTHRGCFVDFVTTTQSFLCACHQATYDFNGGSPTAPAPSPMPHYELSVDGGVFVINTKKEVAASKRYRF